MNFQIDKRTQFIYFLKMLLPKPAVYIETNKPNGILYIGSTKNLNQRHHQHANGQGCHFTKKHHLNHLVWYEYHPTELSAYQREMQLKNWQRAWKVRLILQLNPTWDNLAKSI